MPHVISQMKVWNLARRTNYQCLLVQSGETGELTTVLLPPFWANRDRVHKLNTGIYAGRDSTVPKANGK